MTFNVPAWQLCACKHPAPLIVYDIGSRPEEAALPQAHFKRKAAATQLQSDTLQLQASIPLDPGKPRITSASRLDHRACLLDAAAMPRCQLQAAAVQAATAAACSRELPVPVTTLLEVLGCGICSGSRIAEDSMLRRAGESHTAQQPQSSGLTGLQLVQDNAAISLDRQWLPSAQRQVCFGTTALAWHQRSMPTCTLCLQLVSSSMCNCSPKCHAAPSAGAVLQGVSSQMDPATLAVPSLLCRDS